VVRKRHGQISMKRSSPVRLALIEVSVDSTMATGLRTARQSIRIRRDRPRRRWPKPRPRADTWLVMRILVEAIAGGAMDFDL